MDPTRQTPFFAKSLPPPRVAPQWPHTPHRLGYSTPDDAELLPELLEKVFARLEASETGWPERSALVAVTGVCVHWRGIALRFFLPRPWRVDPGVLPDFAFPCRLQQPVRAPPLFPASRRQSLGTLHSTQLRDCAPRGGRIWGGGMTVLQPPHTVECFVRRHRGGSEWGAWATGSHCAYTMHLGAEYGEGGKFLLAATKARTLWSSKMVVATAPGVRSAADSRCLATVQSNALGTRFKVKHGKCRSLRTHVSYMCNVLGMQVNA